MQHSTGRFIWYELMTTDLDAASDFYGKVIGWTSRDSGQPDMDYRLLSMSGIDVGGLMRFPGNDAESGIKPIWLGYISVANVDTAVAEIVQTNGQVHMPPRDIPNVGRIAFMADPQGAMFYVMRGSMDTPSRAFEPGTPGHGGWNELLTPDWKAAFEFYSRRFAWTKSTAVDMGSMGTYQLFAGEGQDLGGMMNFPEGGRPLWLFYFNVSDIEQARQKIIDHGGQLFQGPMQVPGGQWILQALDPQDGMFALVSAVNSGEKS